MNVTCLGCTREGVAVLADGKLESHYPSPKLTLTPESRCSLSGTQFIDLSTLNVECERCGLPLTTDIDGNLPKHYPNPAKGLSVEGYCGSSQDSGRGMSSSDYVYVSDPNNPSARDGRR